MTPEGPGPHPAVLLCHNWRGRAAFDEDKARQLASLGYAAAALDLYGVGIRGSSSKECEALMMPLLEDPTRLRGRLAAACETIGRLPCVNTDRMGAIGYCFGGLCVLLMARMGLELKAVVRFHGLLKLGGRVDGPPRAKMLVLHGQDDPMVSPQEIAEFAEEMQRIRGDWQLQVYPNAMHALTNPHANDPDFGTVYNPSANARSWQAMQQFLAKAL